MCALTKNFPDKTNGICENAYIIADLTLDNKAKTGRLELAVWSSEEARRGNKSKINNICISVGEKEVWFEKTEVVEGGIDPYPDNKVGDKLYITQLAWDDFAWQNGDYIYKKVKKLKVMISKYIIDLSVSNDILTADQKLNNVN